MIAQNHEIFIAFWVITSVLGIILFFFIYLMIKKQKELIEIQKMTTKSQIKATREERKEITTHLHNDIAPLLAGIKMRINNLKTSDSEEVEICKRALEESIMKIRKLSKDIAPLTMLNISYKYAISQYIDLVASENTLRVHFQDSNNEGLEEDLNNDIYRVLQEIIQNAIRHSKAENLFIEISQDSGYLLIRTKDDGVGYKFNNLLVERKLGIGLLNMKARVESHNGTIKTSNQKEIGTRYNIRIPLNQ